MKKVMPFIFFVCIFVSLAGCSKIFSTGDNNTFDEFTTKVEKASDSSYVVTLIKDWGITVNGKYVKSSWRYMVKPDDMALLESYNNDYLIGLMGLD